MFPVLIAALAFTPLDGFPSAPLAADWAGSRSQVTVAAGILRVATGAPEIWWGSADFGPHQWAAARFTLVSATEQDLTLKRQANGDAIEIRYDGVAHVLKISQRAAGAWSLLAQRSTTMAAGDTLIAEADSLGTVTAWDGNVLIASATAPAWAAKGGFAGLTLTVPAAVDWFAGGPGSRPGLPAPPPTWRSPYRILSFTSPTEDDAPGYHIPIGDQILVFRQYASHDSLAPKPWAMISQWGGRHWPAGTAYRFPAWPDTVAPLWIYQTSVDTAWNESQPSNVVRVR